MLPAVEPPAGLQAVMTPDQLKPKSYRRQLFEKYIGNGRGMPRFDDSDFDKMIFPFFDESEAAYDQLFKFSRKREYKEWIAKFKDPEEQKDIPPLDLKKDLLSIGALTTTTPVYLVEASSMREIRSDP